MRRLLLLFVCLLWASCSGSQGTSPMPKSPDPDTRATLVGPLCDVTRCQCSDNPAEAGQPEAGFKRFRVLLSSSEGELWARVGADNLLYKSVEQGTMCYFVDLPEGEHPVSLRASGNGGFGAHLQISEMGGAGPSYYESFAFRCGPESLCDQQGLRDWKDRIRGVSAGKHAPCGSVRILGLDWQTGRMPDNLHPEDFFLSATMKVYKFAPRHPPGTESCRKG